jgi:hypothetical protein
MKLPFLQKDNWPTAREPEERVVNPSYHAQIQDGLTDEILTAVEKKDHRGLWQSMRSLMRSIREEEDGRDEK